MISRVPVVTSIRFGMRIISCGPINATFANPVENNANSPHPQSALRQLRAEFSSQGTWAAILGIAAILTFAGAFETGELMPFGPRLGRTVLTIRDLHKSYGDKVLIDGFDFDMPVNGQMMRFRVVGSEGENEVLEFVARHDQPQGEAGGEA